MSLIAKHSPRHIFYNWKKTIQTGWHHFPVCNVLSCPCVRWSRAARSKRPGSWALSLSRAALQWALPAAGRCCPHLSRRHLSYGPMFWAVCSFCDVLTWEVAEGWEEPWIDTFSEQRGYMLHYLICWQRVKDGHIEKSKGNKANFSEPKDQDSI